MAKKKQEIYLKTDVTIAFSVDRLITVGIPVEMEEQLSIKDGDWIAIRRLMPKEIEALKLEAKFQGMGFVPE